MNSILMTTHILKLALILISFQGISAAKFTFKNNCQYTVWPGILASSGHDKLDLTGFELPKSASQSVDAPAGWSGRFWGRTNCNFDANGQGSCATGDCGSGEVECNGKGAAPPVTLAEFTLGTGGTSQDFYDVSLVDGYNLPMMVVASSGGTGTCGATGCIADLNRRCPSELRVGDGDACKSACEAFGKPEFCCSGEYANPNTCRPSAYSELFKSACPKSYSYAFDDATSTFTCSGADYEVTFCPTMASKKSSKDSPSGGGGGAASVMLTGDSYMADLATADATLLSLCNNPSFITSLIIIAFILL